MKQLSTILSVLFLCGWALTSEAQTTDISEMDNVMYLSNAAASAGQQVTLSLNMKNAVEARGYQCDIYLPDGWSFAKDEDEFPIAALSTARTTARKTDYFNAVIQKDGSLRILCNSTSGYSFAGNDGEVATIVVQVQDSASAGSYTVSVKNARISDPQAKDHGIDEAVESAIEVKSSALLGDVNNDGKINTGDMVGMVNLILGLSLEGLNRDVADVNSDGKINVGDCVALTNYILYGNF